MENGIPNGDIKMAPVPSVVDLCTTTLKLYGTKTFEDIVAPTLALLDAGEAEWHPKLAITLRRMVEEERGTSGSREQKVQAASDRFYGRNGVNSDIADALENFYIEKGGFLRKTDLAAHVTLVEDPVTVDYPRVYGVQVWYLDARSLPLSGTPATGRLRCQRDGKLLSRLRTCGH